MIERYSRHRSSIGSRSTFFRRASRRELSNAYNPPTPRRIAKDDPSTTGDASSRAPVAHFERRRRGRRSAWRLRRCLLLLLGDPHRAPSRIAWTRWSDAIIKIFDTCRRPPSVVKVSPLLALVSSRHSSAPHCSTGVERKPACRGLARGSASFGSSGGSGCRLYNSVEMGRLPRSFRRPCRY